MEYTVIALDIEREPISKVFRNITVKWADGRVTSHCTPWDMKRDAIITQMEV
jgi:hypothetical protein